MKRVVCLYRVSTLGQVDHDDIPMQRLACREYAETHKDWTIIKEISEKGVSGYKVSAANRDAIVEIKRMAMAREFDVLLVFMFDRLGRKEDETPFVLKWFVSQGIEVWSTREGEQRFDNHVDSLLNFIRFWQASGESEKTSIRVRTKHSQMIQECQWRGGLIPYGYCLVHKGRTNKKGQPVPDLAIDPAESEVVRQIFDLIVNQGYGTNRVAQWLNDQGIKTKRNKTLWRGTSIRSILDNPVYIGILRFGDERSIPFEHLRIVSDEIYERCLSIVKERAPKAAKNRSIPLRTDTRGLLTGLLFCGECGNRLCYGHSYTRKVTSSGEHVYHRNYYRCYRKLSSSRTCTGPTTYTAYPIDNAIISVVRGFFENMREAASPKMLELANKRTRSVIQDAYDKAEAEYESLYRKMSLLEEEAVKALDGTSKFDTDTISSMIAKCRSQLEGSKAYLADMQKKLEKEEASKDGQVEKLKQILSWADMFEQANTETKHMILAKLIERVDVSANGQIQIKFRLTAKEYLGEQPGDVTCNPEKVS